jgi:hypothetical protein
MMLPRRRRRTRTTTPTTTRTAGWSSCSCGCPGLRWNRGDDSAMEMAESRRDAWAGVVVVVVLGRV